MVLRILSVNFPFRSMVAHRQSKWIEVYMLVFSTNIRNSRSYCRTRLHWKSLTNTGVTQTRIDGHDVEFQVVGHGSSLMLCNPGFMATGIFQFGGLADSLKDNLTLVLWNPPYHDENGKIRKLRRKLVEDAEITSKLMQRIHAERYSVFGFSNGCVTSAILASHHPTAVKKLVLCNCPYNFQERDINLSIRNALNMGKEFLMNKQIPPALKAYVDDVGYKNAVDMIIDYSEFMEFEFQEGSISRLFADCCTRVKAPVLILQATEDKFQLHAHAREFSANFSNSSLIEIPGEDHDMMRYVEKIAPRVDEFVNM